jgi:hypothetical protein
LSAGAVFQQAVRTIVQHCLPEVSQRDVLAALEAARPGPLELLYEAGAEAGLAREAILSLSVPIFFNFCAGNLADDLSDGECTYLEEPYRIGPCTQFLLQNFFFYALASADLPDGTIRAAVQELIRAAAPQHLELRTKRWNPALFREIAEGIAGRQWSAYLQILWCATPLAARAVSVGMNAGVAAHTAKDIQTHDPRFVTMEPAAKREIVTWASAAARALHAEHLRCLDAVLRTLEPVLKTALS